MHLVTGTSLTHSLPFFHEAEVQARQSTCFKSQRGAVLVKEGKILAKGWNRPPAGVHETPEDCATICRYYTVHAEQVALLSALKAGYDVTDAIMVHVKVKDGKEQIVAGPSCGECHRLELEAGIGGWLLHCAEGWTFFTAQESYDMANEVLRQQLSHAT